MALIQDTPFHIWLNREPMTHFITELPPQLLDKIMQCPPMTVLSLMNLQPRSQPMNPPRQLGLLIICKPTLIQQPV